MTSRPALVRRLCVGPAEVKVRAPARPRSLVETAFAPASGGRAGPPRRRAEDACCPAGRMTLGTIAISFVVAGLVVVTFSGSLFGNQCSGGSPWDSRAGASATCRVHADHSRCRQRAEASGVSE